MREMLGGLLLAHTEELARILGSVRGLMVFIAMTFMAGAGTASWWGQQRSHEGRIVLVEQWILAHDDTVTGPRIRQLDELAQAASVNILRIRGIEIMLSCIYYEIRPCPNPAPDPPPTGRE